jgi:hypothetical protein
MEESSSTRFHSLTEFSKNKRPPLPAVHDRHLDHGPTKYESSKMAKAPEDGQRLTLAILGNFGVDWPSWASPSSSRSVMMRLTPAGKTLEHELRPRDNHVMER